MKHMGYLPIIGDELGNSTEVIHDFELWWLKICDM